MYREFNYRFSKYARIDGKGDMVETALDEAGFAPMFDGLVPKEIEYEIGYWRKQPDLHGFIVETFASGVDECQRIELDVKNLEQIIEAVEEDNLPHTEGFFSGSRIPARRSASPRWRCYRRALIF